MALSEDTLYDMNDDELEAAFKEAKAQEDSQPDVEPTVDEAEVVEEEIPEEVEVDLDDELDDSDESENDEELDDEELDDEDLEQPLEESDDDASLDDEDEDDSDEESEDEEGELDGEPEAEDDEPTKDEDDSEEDEQPVRKLKYKANGQEYEFTEDEILERFGQVFGQSMNYTQKMQKIKPWRKTIDAIEEAGMSHEDLSLAIDVLKGDKDAIATILKRTGTDALELDVENTEYQPRDYGRNDAELDIKEIVEEISGDKEYQVTYDVLENKWDSKSREAFVENPELIRQLHIDVKNGMFDTIAPMANKMKVYDGGSKSDLDYYKAAAQQYFNEQDTQKARQEADATAKAERDAQLERERVQQEKLDKVKANEQKRKATKEASSKRKAATPTKKRAGRKQNVDYLDDSDEAFEEWYKNLQDKL